MKRTRRPGIPLLLLLIAALQLSGCASYSTHFGVFSASNSAGEERQFRITWMTANYPSWWIADDQTTPVRLETQCSSRIWEMPEAGSASAATDCGPGVRACGDPARDVLVATGQPAGNSDRCMEVTNAGRISELGREVELVVSCSPARVSREVEGEVVNVDYLRASVVPYRIRVREAPRDSLSARPPVLDDDVCDDK